MEGTFDKELIYESNAKELAEHLKDIAKRRIFSDKEILTLELVGDRVITDLLSLFVKAVVNIDSIEKSKTKNEKS